MHIHKKNILYSSCYPPVITETGTSFLILYSGCYPPVTIETGPSFLSTTPAVPTCYYTNKNIIINSLLRLLPTCYLRNRNIISILYSSCYPPAIIQTRTSFLILYSGCYPPVTQRHASERSYLVTAKVTRVIGLYTAYLQLGSHAWDL